MQTPQSPSLEAMVRDADREDQVARARVLPTNQTVQLPPQPGEDIMEGYPCSAGHTAAYITPYGDVFPCVQFPLPSGNVRRQKFIDIWRNSPELNEVRSIRAKDLPVCSTCSHVGTCTRCPGLAYMEGSMRGPSTADCEKSFQRTGILSANMLRKAHAHTHGPLIQIQTVAV